MQITRHREVLRACVRARTLYGNAGLVRFFRPRGKCWTAFRSIEGEHDLRFREIGRVGTTPGFNILLGNHNETPRPVVDFYIIEIAISPLPSPQHRLTPVHRNKDD